MRTLFPIAEATPLYKIGGLGDVGGSLPKALHKIGEDIRLALPLHPEIKLPADHYQEIAFKIVYANQPLNIIVYRCLLPDTNIPVYLFKEDHYLSIHTDASDNHADKFAVFSLAVATWITDHSPYWQPQIIHCHDWHTALIPVILKHVLKASYKTIITIHNLAYQGITTTPITSHLKLNPSECKILSWDKQDGDINILLEGLLHADSITTVSPNYAREILTQEYGEKISAILETKKSIIHGIVNGLDTQFFDPQTDPYLFKTYGPKTWQQGKEKNRQELYRSLKLNISPDTRLISFIGRVDPYQKGVGLIIQSINDASLPPPNTHFIFLGTGDPNLERELHQAADSNQNCTIITRFDEPLAHQLYAASHLSLIPSRFEPCGLVQLIAMRYGALPIARKTGGIADTVFDLQNGFLFEAYHAAAMNQAITKSIQTMGDESVYTTMVNQAMTSDYSWKKSALEYQNLYHLLYLEKSIKISHD